MQEILSIRISRIVNEAKSGYPARNRADLLELAKHGQILPDNTFLLKAVAGPMADIITGIMGPLSLIVPLTEPTRRQVYFAFLAGLIGNGHVDIDKLDEADRVSLITRMLADRNDALIAHAYGSCPTGYLRLISRLGEVGQTGRYYTDLHALLDGRPDQARSILCETNGKPLDGSTLALLRELLLTPLTVRAAFRFDERMPYRRFLRAYRAITGFDQISEEHMQQIADGAAPHGMVEGLYLDLPFPEPVLALTDLTYLSNGHQLFRAAQAFSNCLANFISKAHNGERQYYIWHQPDAPDVIFSIGNEGRFGWYLAEARLARNRRLPMDRRRALFDMLGQHGIRIGGPTEAAVGSFLQDQADLQFAELFEVQEVA